MRRLILPAVMTVMLLAPMMCAELARADDAPKPDDRVVYDMAAEDWVATKTARVTVNVEAAVSGSNSSTMRGDMMKAVGGIANADWRLVNFNRSQDQTGLERWSASFEARLPEASLGGLGDTAKKQSKAGMQLSVGEIDFSPTLDEVEATRANIRTQLYKKASDQLAALNTALPGRTYRLAEIDFSGDEAPRPRFARPMMMNATVASSDAASADVERSEKVKITAHVVFATLAPAPDTKR